jgi:hypothetical protein
MKGVGERGVKRKEVVFNLTIVSTHMERERDIDKE